MPNQGLEKESIAESSHECKLSEEIKPTVAGRHWCQLGSTQAEVVRLCGFFLPRALNLIGHCPGKNRGSTVPENDATNERKEEASNQFGTSSRAFLSTSRLPKLLPIERLHFFVYSTAETFIWAQTGRWWGSPSHPVVVYKTTLEPTLNLININQHDSRIKIPFKLPWE
ncbi:hypothetical protein EYB26_003941 [Talaromyces marneffei]|uniref:uncharacterized protein n=1 Tax=Talaromyces marneffei TaxID=37727 RepID=UPI0012A99013|nr:uncharacterized protein EYB26_003941 [Talaromyces marneffei]QGA16274.1 hypothetical protein EYB26_003941 [Talaromyces marneffei]